MPNPHDQPLFDAAAISTLHNAAVAACDPTDGTTDGQISDPRLCRWDPVAIQCLATVTTNCLSTVQVSAARAMYQGPTTANGHYLRSEEHTSELQSRSDLVCRLLLEKKKH